MSIINGNHQNPEPNLVWLLIKIFCIGTVLGTGAGYAFKEVTELMPSKSISCVTPTENQKLFGLAEYLRLEPGMSLEQVESILDRGTEVERSKTTMTYLWKNVCGSSITVVFKSNKLLKKTQVDLK